MASDMEISDLKVQSDLLDPSFDGYKLSLEPLPTYKSDLVNDLDIASLSDKQYSYQHLKAFGCHNHLLLDQWAIQTACCYVMYFIDKDWNIRCVELTMQDGIQPRLVNVHSPFQVPNPSNLRLVPGRHNVSMNFPAPDWAVIADGAGTLHLVETGPRFGARAGHSNWQMRFSKSDVLGENRGSFVLCDAVMHSDNEGQHTECLLLHVNEADEEMKEKANATFITVLQWLCLTSRDKRSWSVSRTRRLRSSRSADYCSFERNGRALYVAGERAFKLIYDSACPVADMETQDKTSDNQDANLPEYTWLQTMDSMTVNFTVPGKIAKEDIYMTLHPNYIDIGIKNGQVLLSGDLHAAVEVDSSTWTIETNRLTVHLEKKEENMWPLVVIGNTKGEMVVSEEQVAEIHQRLAHLTTEQWNDNPQGSQEKPFNAQELEDCDAYPDMQSVLIRIEGETDSITHQAHLGSHQWLFNTFTDIDKSLAICLRHDVDGLIWQLGTADSREAGTAPWRHVATFNAFGYVQASKQQKKYSVSPPDSSYVAICDCTRHTYIYRQPLAISTPLRNRKTGRQVMAVAKQQVLSLEGAEEILGVQATNKFLFILTPRRLYAVNMETESP